MSQLTETPGAAAPHPDLKTPDEIRRWLTDTMAEQGLSAIEWATRAGVARSTLFRALNPDYAFVTSRRTLAKLAAALEPSLEPSPGAKLGVDRPEPLRGATRPGSASRTLRGSIKRAGAASSPAPVLALRFEVQRSAWYECGGPDFKLFFEGFVPGFGPDSRFPDARQWLEIVRDDSADLQILPGSFAHVVDADDIAYAPRQGDWVVVERTREAGQLIERTIRQVDLRGGSPRVVLRSSNPRLTGAADADVALTSSASAPEPDTPQSLGSDTAGSDAERAGRLAEPSAAGPARAAAGGYSTAIAGLVVGAYRVW